jgi:hypothetical protein
MAAEGERNVVGSKWAYEKVGSLCSSTVANIFLNLGNKRERDYGAEGLELVGGDGDTRQVMRSLVVAVRM